MPCPECGAARGHLLGCSHVEAPLRAPRAPEVPALDEEGRLERRRLWAFPAAFLSAWLLVSTEPGAFLGRACFGMWLHELGHALAAWLCGRWALPLPWFTFTFGRSWLVTAGICVGLFALGRHARRVSSKRLMALATTVGVVALGGHLLPPTSQELLFTFSGEAGAMLLGALLSTAFLLPEVVRPLRGGLRWGWLVIGAVSWADAAHLWVMARRDPANLPFGTENGTASDATKLVDQFHWAEDLMVSRYLWLAALTLGGALVAWAVVLRRAHQRESTRAAAAATPARSRR